MDHIEQELKKAKDEVKREVFALITTWGVTIFLLYFEYKGLAQGPMWFHVLQIILDVAVIAFLWGFYFRNKGKEEFNILYVLIVFAVIYFITTFFFK
jgi:hypothetical protein